MARHISTSLNGHRIPESGLRDLNGRGSESIRYNDPHYAQGLGRLSRARKRGGAPGPQLDYDPDSPPRGRHHGRQRPLGEGAAACPGSKAIGPERNPSGRSSRRAPGSGVQVLTLYAFSRENWKRPKREVPTLWRLLEEYLRKEDKVLIENDFRLRVLGQKDGLPPSRPPRARAGRRR